MANEKVQIKGIMNYESLKKKYHGLTHGNKRQGVQCKVIFIETDRCTELWFLYHFTQSATTKEFRSYHDLEKELCKYRPRYEKTEKYFKSVVDLHKEFTKKCDPQGSLANAIKNSKDSIKSRQRDNRNYSYSEIHILFDALKIESIENNLHLNRLTMFTQNRKMPYHHKVS